MRAAIRRITHRFVITIAAIAAQCLIAHSSATAKDLEIGLLFSTRTWDGEFTSKDVPGGVETTPVRGAIYAIGVDGTGLKKIVEHGTLAEYPSASPDGKWIYFQSNAGGHHEVYRCDWDGKSVSSLTPTDEVTKRFQSSSPFNVKSAYGYALSADGGDMIYTVHDGSSGRVVFAKADGTESRLLAPQLGYAYMAKLSPRNDQVVFSGPAKNYRLLTAKLPEGKPIVLTPDHPECFVPQFTPDGKTIVFIRRDGDIYSIASDGTNFRQLTKGNRYVEFKLSASDKHGSTDGPDISPDGKRIAYIAVKDDVANVFVMNIDGSQVQQITSRKSACGRVRWSPDGKQLAFVSFVGKYPQLFVVSADVGEPRQLTKHDGAVYFSNWYSHEQPKK